jgi:hypothetical protein
VQIERKIKAEMWSMGLQISTSEIRYPTLEEAWNFQSKTRVPMTQNVTEEVV